MTCLSWKLQHKRFSDYNPGQNILGHYNVLVQVRFPTSKTKLDMWYKKIGIKVVSRLATRPKN